MTGPMALLGASLALLTLVVWRARADQSDRATWVLGTAYLAGHVGLWLAVWLLVYRLVMGAW